jgi:hypothetical protein
MIELPAWKAVASLSILRRERLSRSTRRQFGGPDWPGRPGASVPTPLVAFGAEYRRPVSRLDAGEAEEERAPHDVYPHVRP